MKRFLFFTTLMLLLAACGSNAGQLNNRGNKAYTENNYPEALNAYRGAQEKSPALPEPYYNAANTYYQQKNYQQAELQYQLTLRHAPETLKQQTLYNRGNLFYKNQQYQQAAEVYKEALRLNPNDEQAKYNLELTLQKLQEQNKQEQQQEDQEQNKQEQEEQDQQQSDQEQNKQEQNQDQSDQPDPPNEESPPPQQNQNPASTQPQPGQPEVQPMTRDQARQLLQSIADDSETLQQHLQQLHGQSFTNQPPDQDW